jgi:GTP-binding protein LepA
MIEKIRNFAIIAHVDHGKSTLADRFLEITKTIPESKIKPQYLDMLSLEREKGITIKMQPVSMNFNDYVLNLIDTPGHSDFSYEVSRALKCVEGAILLVDVTQGIQAQTVYNLKIAQELNLKIIPAINKVDLDISNIDIISQDLKNLLNVSEDEIHLISGKTGYGVEKLIEDIIKKIPAPQTFSDTPKALIFDSHFDTYKGIIAHIRVFGGEFKKDKIYYLKSKNYKFKSIEVGIFKPELKSVESLKAGEIGYIATGIKEPDVLKIGDTIVENFNDSAIPGYKEPISVIFTNIFPKEEISYEKFKDSLFKLKLNDPSLNIEPINSPVFGRGYLVGFLGLLHLEIFQERLKREFGTEVVLTLPSVKYEVVLKNKQTLIIQNISELPDFSKILEIREPWSYVEIFVHFKYLESVFNLIKQKRGGILNHKTMTSFVLIEAEMPLEELITGFYDDLKSITSGYASINWEFLNFRKADLVKLDILIAEEVNPALSRLVFKNQAYYVGKKIVTELKKLLPREQFPVKLQAAIGGRIIARETIPALKADVAGWLYGGDITRKMKLWQKQKKGKKKLEKLGKGKVNVPNDVLIKILQIK